MPRNLVINGETMVFVKGGSHYSGGPISDLSELGLSVDEIRIFPRYFHSDMRVDGFGMYAPADVQWMLADCSIRMNLIHYDSIVLDLCMKDSMAGGMPGFLPFAGVLAQAGTMMGAGQPPLSSGCYYIMMGLTSPVHALPWLFPTCYLAEPPVMIPLGNTRSITQLNWRAVPYGSGLNMTLVNNTGGPGGGPMFAVNELSSSGVILWDNIDIRDLEGDDFDGNIGGRK